MVDTNYRYEYPPHIHKLNEALLKIAYHKINRLMVFMPPRHGKSELISKYYPAWYLGRFPNRKLILCSYEADFAATWGRQARNILDYHGKDFGVQIDKHSAARNRWDIKGHEGGMVTAGSGGPITGKGGDLIIDDPVKNSEEANSPTMRDKVWEWFNSTAYTRLEPDGTIIFVMTHWHEDDLGSRILENTNEKWTVISLPAIADENDLLKRELGEPLWPDRYPLTRLEEIKNQIGDYWFSALYQQKPQPSEGGLLKREWLHYYEKDEIEPFIGSDYFHVYQGWDLAISEKTSADYTVCATIGHNTVTNNVYIMDWYRGQIDFPTQVRMVQSLYDKWTPLQVGIEDVAYQRALPQAVLDKRLLPIRQVKRVKDKTTRILSRFVYFEQDRVFLPENHPSLKDFESEYVYFPHGRYDDMLDATELALGLIKNDTGNYTRSKRRYAYSKK